MIVRLRVCYECLNRFCAHDMRAFVLLYVNIVYNLIEQYLLADDISMYVDNLYTILSISLR